MKLSVGKKRYAGGFTLVELLVSLVIASIIMSGVVQVALSGKRSAMDNEEVAFIEDNARFVIDYIKRDSRSAGFKGCAGPGTTSLANVVGDDVDGFISLEESVQGFDDSANDHPSEYKSDVKSGTDSFIVRFADASQEYEVKEHDESASEFTLWTTEDIQKGATFLATDASCRHVAVFQSTGASGNSDTIEHGGSANCSDVIKVGSGAEYSCSDCTGSGCGTAVPFLPGSSIMPYKSYAYYVGDSDVIAGMPALKRRALSSDGSAAITEVEEIALGVEDLQLTYGVDIDSPSDGVANRFVNADDVTDWSQVVSLRMMAVFRSSGQVYTEDQSVTVKLDGNSVALTSDKFLRQVVTTNISFRNI